MKKRLPRPVLALLIIGLMMVSVAPLISHRLGLSDSAAGFLTGLGIGIEVLALIVAVRYKRAA